ncbi:MAG TPA: LytTR family DNA-binding domain-containing protein [Verrucomicrobiae bacterium]|nr:LytTR family DNA-binding domain-containing protein [Verrucomicrobiae bacterium]
MTLRVLIADDEAPARTRLRDLVRSEPHLDLVAECADGLEALKCIRDRSPDLVFLDVRMPELDGFAVLEALKGHPVPAVIFVTAHHEFAVRAFEVHAVDYLLKPFDKERFQAAVRRARSGLQKDSSARSDQLLSAVMASVGTRHKTLERLPVKSHGRISVIAVREIDWIGTAANYAELHVGKRSYLLRITIKTLADQLVNQKFIQISRFHLVNSDRIKEVHPKPHGDYEVLLHDGTRLPGSRSHRHKLAPLLSGEV